MRRRFPHDRKSAANDYAAQVEHEKRSGDYVDPKAGDITFAAYAERWIVQHHGADNTKITYTTSLNHHVGPAIGGQAIRKVTREQVRELLLETIAKKASGSAVSPARTLIVAVLGEAVRSGRIELVARLP